MNPVLLATDGSPAAARATDTAIELAQLLDTELVVVCVWDLCYAIVGLAPIPISGELSKMEEDEARTVAAESAARAAEAGVKARTVVLRGQPVKQICLAAETYDPRFLVVGSHGWGAAKRALLGSVSTAVLHHAKCPVLVVRGEAHDIETTSERRHGEVHA
jgi:nucleotide-binding universal stress UspA family protein